MQHSTAPHRDMHVKAIVRFRDWVRGLSSLHRAGVAFAAGSVSVAAFAPFFASPVLFVTLAVFVWLIDASPNVRSAARIGWWFGFGFFFFSLVWLGEAFLVEADKFAVLLPFAVTLLPAGMALFWSSAAAGARQFWTLGPSRIFIFALALVTAEWLRGHVLTGLPWNVLGYALTAPLALMQGAAVFGAYGMTAIALAVFTTPLVLLGDGDRLQRRSIAVGIVLATIVPLLLLTGYGAWRLAEDPQAIAGVRLRIVQPSVLQTEKWRPEHQARIFQDHLSLSATNPKGIKDDLAGITHVVWPEAAMPFLPLEHPEAIAAIGALLPDGVTLITGALRREATDATGERLPIDQHRLFNGLLVFNDKAELVASYDKIHLVPFGEFLPAEALLTALGLKKLTHGQGSFAVGKSPRPTLDIAGLPLSLGLICYEALFPGEIFPTAPDRPELLINVTNDGWFGNSTGPRQHFHQTRVRAVEEGVALIRAANNGISAVVDRYGRVVHSLGMDEKGVIDSNLPGGSAPTFYARWGDTPLAALLLAFLAIAAVLRRIEQS